MTVGMWILIVAVGVVAIPAVVVAVGIVRNRSRTRRLKRHYGDEYQRLLSEAGSEKAVNRELTTRERRRDGLDLVPLTPTARSNFISGWQEVQASFVDSPASAVAAADRLVIEVMRERGYPVGDFERRAADVSVDHPEIVTSYRAAHRINTSRRDQVSIEQQRVAVVHYRTLFETLIGNARSDTSSQEAVA